MGEFLSQVLVVIVTYNRAFHETPVFRAFAQKKELEIAVYDNSLNSQEPVDKLNGRCHYFHQPENPGVGASYNRAALLASEKGKTWLLFFDHDTVVDAGYIDICKKAVEENPGVKLFCPVLATPGGKIVSPYRQIWFRSFMLKSVCPGTLNSKNIFAVNSGMLVQRESFEGAGGYHPLIRLDFSDNYFFRRFMIKYGEFFVLDATLGHTLNSGSEENVGQALHRFRIYCSDAALYAKDFSFCGMIVVQAFLRAVKLSFVWRSIDFMRLFFSASKVEQ